MVPLSNGGPESRLNKAVEIPEAPTDSSDTRLHARGRRRMNTRRSFIGGLAAPGLLLGLAPAAELPADAAPAPLGGQSDDASLFAAAREHFVIPAGVAYCNTG